ncbi:MAG TPA: NUDIX hydrolase [Candidatus Polarisedimenticolaceae bacterium]|nr:NUDIX hydrolase [Candidatus Polarisedimenticolaceae bacterium]
MSDAVVVSSRSVHDGRVVKLAIEDVRLPNGNVVSLEIIRHPGAAAVVPLDGDGNVLLVRQYRHATRSWVLEVPAGKLDHPGEDPDACALREVEEETGYRAGRLTALGWIWTTPGFTDEKIWLYLARDLAATRPSLQPDEVLTVERLPLREAARRALDGEITDGKSVCALLRAAGALQGNR